MYTILQRVNKNIFNVGNSLKSMSHSHKKQSWDEKLDKIFKSNKNAVMQERNMQEKYIHGVQENIMIKYWKDGQRQKKE